MELAKGVEKRGEKYCLKNIRIMTSEEFFKLSSDLRTLAKNTPLNWGRVQNNRNDDKIDMFSIQSYDELEKVIERLSDTEKNYLKRRWYLWRCSQCDEYLFCVNDNVESNPNPYDKTWDIRFNSSVYFDVKGTVVPISMRPEIESLIKDPEKMIRFYYDEQSKGRRYNIQNRLFVVHHSFVDPLREFYLRCAWESKRDVYKLFSENADRIKFIEYKGVKSAVIFILERERKVVSYEIYGL